MDDVDGDGGRLVSGEEPLQHPRRFERRRLIGEHPDDAAVGDGGVERSLNRIDDEPRLDRDGGALLPVGEGPASGGRCVARDIDGVVTSEEQAYLSALVPLLSAALPR